MKKILIPTDFSDNAWDALTYAIRLYDDIPCRFYILNTFEVVATGVNASVHTGATRKLFTILREDSEKGLLRIKDYLDSNLLNDKHEYNILSSVGSVVDIAQEIISREHIDLVVMGTTGASGLKEVFMGSTAMKLINSLDDCPVIAVPKNYEYQEPTLVSFATDLKKLFNVHELNILKELLLIHNLELEILHVKKEKELTNTQKQNIELIKQLLSIGNVHYKEIPFEKSVAQSINSYTQNNDVAIICLAKYEHNFIERLTHEPVIKKVGFHSEIPLLVISV